MAKAQVRGRRRRPLGLAERSAGARNPAESAARARGQAEYAKAREAHLGRPRRNGCKLSEVPVALFGDRGIDVRRLSSHDKCRMKLSGIKFTGHAWSG